MASCLPKPLRTVGQSFPSLPESGVLNYGACVWVSQVLMNEWLGGGVGEAHSAPVPYLVNSSNLLKATMAPIRWHSGEKPLSMKSSLLCLSRSGSETLMGMAILQGEEKGKLRQLLPIGPSEPFP